MSEPTAALLALRASTADLVRGLENENWSDADVRAPSLCPGWTRAHVLTHLARNADGIAGTLAGALRGEIVAQYPGGSAARDDAIAAGAALPLAELVADVTDSAQRLDRVLGAVVDADAWSRPTDRDLVARDWVFHRFREIEVHRVDLAGTYRPERWPPLLVGELLPLVAATLAERTDDAVRVEVAADGSIVAELGGTVWQVGPDPAAEVVAPDWAVLAWLVGRGAAVADALPTAPVLRAWR